MPILRKISNNYTTRIKYFKICRALGCGGILGRQFCNVTNKPKAQEIIKFWRYNGKDFYWESYFNFHITTRSTYLQAT